MYITYEDVGDFLNITVNESGQEVLSAIINGIEAYVNRACGRKWNNTNDDIVELFDGNGQEYFYPKQIPIKSITSIAVDGSTLSASEYFNYRSYIRVNRFIFSAPQGVVVTYKSDAQAIPADLKHGMIQWAAQLFKSQDDGGKVASRVTTGAGISVDYLTKDGVPHFMEVLINAYRIHNI